MREEDAGTEVGPPGELRPESDRRNMKNELSALCVMLVCALALAFAHSQLASAAATEPRGDGIYGYWKSVDKDTGKTQSVFEVYPAGDKLAGKIVKAFPKPGEEYDPICHECTGNQKDKPKVGLVFLWDFTRAKGKPRKWIDGKLLNPENGKTYGAELEVSEDGQQLTVYGYIRILFKIGGSNVWVRPTAEELKGVQ